MPRGFIPTLDQGYAIVVIQLPDGSSLSRTDAVVQRASKIMQETPGVQDAVAFAGFSGATFTNATNAAAIFARFKPFDERLQDRPSATPIIGQLFGRMQQIEEAFIIAIPPPPVRGLGNSGGFKMQLQERTGDDVAPRAGGRLRDRWRRAGQNPNLAGVFTTFSANSPQIYLEIDRTKARMLNVPIPNIFETLQVNLGTAYVNDFNCLRPRLPGPGAGRPALPRRSATTSTGCKRALVDRRAGAARNPRRDARCRPGRDLVQRYNMYTSVPLQGNAAPGVSSGTALDAMESARGRDLPPGHELRVDGARLPGAADRQHGDLHLRALGAVRLPGARGAVRKLVAAARDHPDRADGRAVGADRRDAARAWTTTS